MRRIKRHIKSQIRQFSIITLIMLGIITLFALYDLQHETMRQIRITPKPSEAVDISKLPIAKKKQYFIEKTLPAIINAKKHLDEQYTYIEMLSKRESLTRKEGGKIEYLKRIYKAKDTRELLKKLHTHPISIILAQAALETGWGTSRFYTEANNIFGIWSYNPNEPRIAASETRGAKTIYVKKYASLEESIEGYFFMMATGRAYSKFRNARMKEKNPFKLLKHLGLYSELRGEYIKRLYHVIKSNRFYAYDTPSFSPIALSRIVPEKPKKPTEAKRTKHNKVTPDSNASAALVKTVASPGSIEVKDQNSTEAHEHNQTASNDMAEHGKKDL